MEERTWSEERTMDFSKPPAVSPDSSIVSQDFSDANNERNLLLAMLKLQTLHLRRLLLQSSFQRWTFSDYRKVKQWEADTEPAVELKIAYPHLEVPADLVTEVPSPDYWDIIRRDRHFVATRTSETQTEEAKPELLPEATRSATPISEQVLRRVLRTQRVRERQSLGCCLHTWRWLTRELDAFQRSGYSPSVSYLSIGEECCAQSPQGRFQLQALELMSESNRHAAVLKMAGISKRLSAKRTRCKQKAWALWAVHSLKTEVRYYRALIRSVDETLQTARKREKWAQQKQKRQNCRLSTQAATVLALAKQLL